MDGQEPSYFKYQPLLLALCTLIGLYGGYKLRLPSASLAQNSEPVSQNTTLANRKIKETFEFLDARYADSVNFSEVSDYMIEQLMFGLDPYSEFISAKRVNSYYKDLDALSAGTGIKTLRSDSSILVSELHPNSPAWSHGIVPGCRILKVNDRNLGMQLMDLDSLATTHAGPNLTLNFINPFENKEHRVTLEAVDLPQPSIPLDFSEQGFFYIKLEKLGHNSYREFMRKMEEYCIEKKQTKLILDLRGNSGGLLNTAADILNQLVPIRDRELFSVAFKNGNKKSYKATGKPFFRLSKIIILTDQHTASSAEIIAGSLQDLKLAKVMGENTKGKATVLEAYKLSDGSQILLATSRILLPSGRTFQKPYSFFTNDSSTQWLSLYSTSTSDSSRQSHGIIPDVPVSAPLPDPEFNPYLSQSLEIFMLNQFNRILDCFNHKVRELDRKKMELVVQQMVAEYATSKGIRSNKTEKLNFAALQLALNKTMGAGPAIHFSLEQDPVFKMAKKEINSD